MLHGVKGRMTDGSKLTNSLSPLWSLCLDYCENLKT